MGGLDTLEYFQQITQIPRPSRKEEQMRTFLIERATEMGFTHKRDAAGNLVVAVPATLGREHEEGYILQAHMDMVCEKDKETEYDFLTQGIETQIVEKEGEKRMQSKDQKTTLGADNGWGLAMIMDAVTNLESHPPLTLLFTVDEETGLNGAEDLDPELLRDAGNRLINLDTEDEGEICIGSAGGARVIATAEFPSEAPRFPQYTVSIDKMRGGHSGVQIHENRGNAMELLMQFVKEYRDTLAVPENFQVVSINGGGKHNAIPRDCEITVGCKNREEFKAFVEKRFAEEIGKYAPAIDAKEEEYAPVLHISDELPDQKNCLKGRETLFDTVLLEAHSGIIAMSQIAKGVQTSRNLGIVKTNGGVVELTYLTRSSVDQELDEDIAKLHQIFEALGYDVTNENPYYGWQQDPNDPLIQSAISVFREVYGKEPKVIAVHAGLECSTLGKKMAQINGKKPEIVSFGPTIRNPHSPQEEGHLDSLVRTKAALFGILSSPQQSLN